MPRALNGLSENRQRIQEGQYEQPYHWILSRNAKGLYDLRTKIVMELLGDLKGKKVLDVGCGDGKFTSALTSRAVEVQGIDLSKRAILFAKNLVRKATFLVVDASHLCFKNETFDIITCLDVMEHLPENERERTIREVYRVIKKKGILIFSVPSKNMPLIKKHYIHFDKTDLVKFFSAHLADEIMFIGCGVYYPIIYRFQNWPIIWKLVNKLIVKTCSPNRAMTLIMKCKGFGVVFTPSMK